MAVNDKFQTVQVSVDDIKRDLLTYLQLVEDANPLSSSKRVSPLQKSNPSFQI